MGGVLAGTGETLSDSLRTGHHSALAYLHLLQGDLNAAAAAIEEGWVHFNPELNDFAMALLPLATSMVKQASGAHQEALNQIDQLLDAVQVQDVGMFRADLLLQKGEALRTLDRTEEVAAVLAEARATAEEMGAARARWRILAALAQIVEEQGDRARARDLYQLAADQIRAIARNVDDQDLRTSFLATPAVQTVLAAME